MKVYRERVKDVKPGIILNSSYLASVIVLTSVYIFSAIGAQNQIVGLGLAVLEWLILVMLALQGDYFKTFCLLIAFITTSFETTTFTSDVMSDDTILYSVYSLPIVRSMLCYAFIIFLCAVFHGKYFSIYREKVVFYPEMKKMINFFPVMLVTSVFTGFVVFLLDDNGVATSGWYFTKYIEFTIKIITLMSLIYTSALICICNPQEGRKLETFCEQLIVSAAIATTITLFLGFRGAYGSKGTLIFMPLATSISAVLILFYGFKQNNKRLFLWGGVIFTLEILFIAGSHMGSKFYLVPALSFIVLVINGMKNGKLGYFVGVGIIALVIALSGGFTITNTYIGSYNNWKLNQLLQMFQLSGDSFNSWYLNLPQSPRVRIDEFVSTWVEYINKPWYLLFGKGTAGTITHLWGTTIWNVKGNGTFSDYEIDSGIFMFMHESVNVLFIRHGLLGLVFFVTVVIMLIKKLSKSPWTLVALIWFVFYWGTYRSWWLGAVALVLALTTNANDSHADQLKHITKNV